MKYLTIVIEYENDKEPIHPLAQVHDKLLDGVVVGWRRSNALDELDALENMVIEMGERD